LSDCEYKEVTSEAAQSQKEFQLQSNV